MIALTPADLLGLPALEVPCADCGMRAAAALCSSYRDGRWALLCRVCVVLDLDRQHRDGVQEIGRGALTAARQKLNAVYSTSSFLAMSAQAMRERGYG